MPTIERTGRLSALPTAGPSRRVVKLVKFPAFRPYTRARAQPRITPQKYRSSPTSPRAAGWSIGPHETRGNPARHVVPSRVRRGGEYRSLRCPAAPRRALRNAARSPPPAPAGCRRRRARRRGRDGRRCADDGLGGQFRGHLAATLTRRSAMKVRHGWFCVIPDFPGPWGPCLKADLHISAARIAARRRVWLIPRAARPGAARRPAWPGARGW